MAVYGVCLLRSLNTGNVRIKLLDKRFEVTSIYKNDNNITPMNYGIMERGSKLCNLLS